MNPFGSEDLWLKSRLFINRSLDDDREFEERAFWAVSALELLGKSALARISPLLIANPMDDGASLLVASGVTGGNATSVQAKAVWSRCARAFKPFNEKEAKRLSVARNEYIHAAGIGFDTIPEMVWWTKFWPQVDVLLRHMGLEISDFVDAGSVSSVNSALATHRDNISRQLTSRIERSRTMLRQAQAGTLSPRQLNEWKARTYYLSTHSTSVECPACERSGTLYGDDEVETHIEYEQGAWGEHEALVTLEISPHGFYCNNCHLDLNDYELLVEADLGETFDVEGDAGDIPNQIEYENE